MPRIVSDDLPALMTHGSDLDQDTDLGLILDRLAAHAWLALETEIREGWWLRFNEGLHRRANSVFPEDAGSSPLEEKINNAESFYNQRGVLPRFQVSPVARPDGLDAVLAARGYEVESGVDIMIANTEMLRGRKPSDQHDQPVLEAVLSPDWLNAHMANESDEAIKVRKSRMLQRISRDHVFGSLRVDDNIVSVGLAVAEGEWFGIFGMYTLAEARRRGYSTQIIGAMADWALARGARQAYLQVERDNPAALAVYTRAGFKTVHGYHYRTLWNTAK